MSVRYRQTIIGVAWAVIRPFLTMVVFTVICGRIAALPSGGVPYALMVFAAMLPWSLFSTALGEASNSLIGNERLISKVYFPRLIIPTATVVTAFVDFLISFVILLGLMVYYRFVPGWNILLLPLFIVMALLASLGPGLWVTALNVKYRDFRYVIPFLVQFGLYVALRDVLTHNVRSMWHKTKDLLRGDVPVQGETREDIWALRDLDFEIRQGEVVGIIGRNGSGKSTLLKILSRITEPTEGRVSIRGRVSSLLEVGTGFHPELTGRENIFLNGAILGMTRAEIRRKFDEIVAFAEIEKFLDTPVKRYSSGMYVRLAFAVAAHLEPEILLVDEVLAVGDAAFQSKCIGKMEGVAREGRTLVFVSRDIAAGESLCTLCFLLEGATLELCGTPHDDKT